MSRNYLTCPRCGFAMRTWGRRLDAVTAAARAADHLRYIHPTGAAAVSAAIQQGEKSMPVHHTKKPHHTIIHINHDAATHIHELAQKLVADAKAAGIDIGHAGILTDGEHVELHHAPKGEHPIE